jgi:transitional endoplasmic reticulum ATPase
VPDKPGRKHILGIHTAKMPLAKDVDLGVLAGRTDKFTGADLEDLVRRAGLAALRESLKSKKVTMAHFESALTETRASVTADMEQEYAKIHTQLKADAFSPLPSMGFIAPGMVKARAEKS